MTSYDICNTIGSARIPAENTGTETRQKSSHPPPRTQC